MTLKIVRHDPPPAPRPPVTYDITGLTEKQLDALRYVLDTVKVCATPGTRLYFDASGLIQALGPVPEA